MSLKNGGLIKEPTKGILGDEIFLQYEDSILNNISFGKLEKSTNYGYLSC